METLKHAPALRTRSRLSLLLLLAFFAAPVVLAWLAFYVFPEWRPAGTSNHGQLITPLRPLPAFEVETLSGDRIDETFLRGKWTLVYLVQGACAEPCVRQLYNLRQVRLAQGKNIDRVQRLMLWDVVGVAPEQRAELSLSAPDDWSVRGDLLLADTEGARLDVPVARFLREFLSDPRVVDPVQLYDRPLDEDMSYVLGAPSINSA